MTYNFLPDLKHIYSKNREHIPWMTPFVLFGIYVEYYGRILNIPKYFTICIHDLSLFS